MKQIFHARKQRQLRGLVKRFKTLSKDFQGNGKHQIDALVRKIKTLTKELSFVLAPFHLKKILGPAAFILGVSFGAPLAAQSFAAPQENPFGLTASTYYAFPAFADLDGDGDLDLMAGEGGDYGGALKYYKNIGSSTNPQFAAPIQNPFGIIVSDTTYLFPTFADLDHDGDKDLIAGDNYGTFQYYKNTGTVANPQFAAPLKNPFGLSNTNYNAFPTFVDLDGDGDLDLLAGDYGGNMQYFKNTGTISNPNFAAPQQNPFGITAAYEVGFPTFADLDKDGDQDLLVGEYYGNMQYFKNTGTASNPQFAASQQNPFGLSQVYQFAFPDFADLDGDGDMDLLVGEYYGNMQYFKNTSPVGTHEQNANFALDLNPNPVANVLNIQTEMAFEKVAVYDALGRLCRHYDGALASINVSDWETGTYLLKFTDAEGQYVTRQIVKE